LAILEQETDSMAPTETPEPQLGQIMPNFILAMPDGTQVTLTEAVGERGAVVAFICNHCPYVKAMAGRLAEDARTLREAGVETLAVMPNDWDSHPEDAPERMGAFAEAHRFDFPYLIDVEQTVARDWGAVCTPDLFGVGPDLTLLYRGRLDDLGPREGSGTRTRELVEAMTAQARPVEGQHASIGCSIKWR
jgi:peroxiredoxin